MRNDLKIFFDFVKVYSDSNGGNTNEKFDLIARALVDEALRLKAFEISKVAFQQKRKKIKSALSEYIDEDMAVKLSLNLDLRPQELTPEDYLAIAESIQ